MTFFLNSHLGLSRSLRSNDDRCWNFEAGYKCFQTFLRIPRIASTDELTECWKIRQGTERRWDMTFTWIWSWKFKDNNKSWPKLCFQLFALIPCRLVDIITYSTVDRNNRISMYVHCTYAKENWKRTVEFLCFTTDIAFMQM